MKTSNAQFTVAEYVSQMKTGDIRVNKEYQRSSTVWPAAARSYLIDTILLGFPVPKLSLYQKTDLRKRTTIKEIVDGQQRSQAVLDFFENKLRLSGHSTFRNKIFEQLEPKYQEQFLSYPLSADIFSAATQPEIREVFRRINSYNVPLNAAEKRHATFQGEFKWFIVKLCEKYSQTLKDLGVFSEPQLSRMYDATLFSEVCQTFMHGIDHSSEPKLSGLYRDCDPEFPMRADFQDAIDKGMKYLIKWRGIHDSPLYKAYNVYSLMTAIGHATHRFPSLQGSFRVERRTVIRSEEAVERLAMLSRALEEEDKKGSLASFIEACAEKTNRKGPRITRFEWFCKALTRKQLK